MKKIKVFITDDHNIFVEGLVQMFLYEEAYEVCGKAYNYKETIDLLPLSNADVILLDLNLPDRNGIEILDYINRHQIPVKTIILSMYKEPAFVSSLKNKGASAYLAKNTTKEELLFNITEAYKGEIDLWANNPLASENIDLDTSDLTEKELEIIQFISDGMTDQEISEKLYISIHTSKKYRKKLLDKFNANNTAELIKIVIKMGLI